MSSRIARRARSLSALALLSCWALLGAVATSLADTGTTAPKANPESAEGEPAAPADIQYPVPVAGGSHWRLESKRGPIHIWIPDGFTPERAGVVFYVHGYYDDVDEAWAEHRLAEQFAASGRHALFIVPEAPRRSRHKVRWRNSGELMREVAMQTGLARPWGPVVAVGHSGAYRTLVAWLDDGTLEQILLLDGLYRKRSAFQRWLDEPAAVPRRLTLVAMDTIRESDPWVRELSYARELPWIPEDIGAFPTDARGARLLLIRSQYDHMEIVTEGRVMPVLLQDTRLPPVTAAASGPR